MAQITMGPPSGPHVTAYIEVWMLALLKELDTPTFNKVCDRAAQMQRDMNAQTQKGLLWTPDGTIPVPVGAG
jgi:hypothetical protein